MKRLFLVFVGLLILVFLVPPAASQTVVQRMRLGNNVEGAVYIPTGPYAQHIAIIDGYQLIAFAAQGRGNAPARPLFDFRPLGLIAPPRGVAWIDPERLFAFTDVGVGLPTTTLTFADHRGQFHHEFVFTWPDDLAGTGTYTEGIAWIPLDAPLFPGHLAFVARATDGVTLSSIFIITRDGTLAHRIVLPVEVDPIGLAYRDGRLLVSSIGNQLWELDFTGAIIVGPFLYDGVADIEGVAVLPGGKPVLASYAGGKLLFLDAAFARLPYERSFLAGFGLGSVSGAAWDSATSEYLVLARTVGAGPVQIAAISADLASSRIVLDMTSYSGAFFRLDFLDAEGLIAMPRRDFPREMLFFDSAGAALGGLPASFNIVGFTLYPGNNHWAIRRAGAPLSLEFYGRYTLGGPPLFTIDLSAAGFTSIVDVAYLGGDQFLLHVSGPSMLVKIDLAGNVLQQWDYTALNAPGLGSVKPVTSGPHAGAFAGIDGTNSELIVFTLP